MISFSKNYSHFYLNLFWREVKFFILLLCLFFVYRVSFLFLNFSTLSSDAFSTSHIFYALISSIRFDMSIASVTGAIPLLIIATASLTFIKKHKLISYFLHLYHFLIIFLCWAVSFIDLHYFSYYNDHYNFIMWEFFENFTNSLQVVRSIPLELSFINILSFSTLSLLITCYLFLDKWKLPFFIKQFRRNHFIVFSILWILAMRGTLSSIPLTIQDKRFFISNNLIINKSHTNPFFPLYHSYRAMLENQKFNNQDYIRTINHEPLVNLAQELGTQVSFDQSMKAYRLKQTIYSTSSKTLKSKPKKVVFLLLESYSSWVLDHPDEKFSSFITSSLRKVINKGISFENHYSGYGGTLGALSVLNLNLPIAKNFHPSPFYYQESFRPLPTKLPKKMKEIGYQPSFIYAGFASWHNLSFIMSNIGYNNFYAENNFPEEVHHPYIGLHDDGFYKALNEKLKESTNQHFFFALNQSNHEPYIVPKEYEKLLNKIYIPERIYQHIGLSRKDTIKRLLCFYYADQALGRFFQMAAKEDYFKDTLFVLTGDHVFRGLNYTTEEIFKESKVPFVIYAPHLLKDNYIGKKVDVFSNHFDIYPTLLSLLHDSDFELDTWGRNVLQDNIKAFPTPFYTNDLSCHYPYCDYQGRLYEVDKDLSLNLHANPEKHEEILKTRKLFDESALYYLFHVANNKKAKQDKIN